ncbi:MAG: hypothetical protein B7Z44_06195 [Caulobacter sp. 12-67-6]|nr:MAG: hypothetical protein B7Z44_06195 [Caulobacter sp. 12-67-6]OYX74046.1 MAG: hypothetical protein B7Y81_01185 [Caulobacter sp. 32-67-35]
MIRIRSPRFKSPLARGGVVGLLAGMSLALVACDGSGQDEWRPKTAPPSTQTDAAEAGYIAPPQILGAERGPAGLVLKGVGTPQASVRLGAPTGESVVGQIDASGGWSLAVPQTNGVGLYGLSMTRGGRTVQAEGYVMVTPEGELALLRAGAGAWRLSPGSASPNILAIDVDQEGGAVISGVATPGAGLGVRVDRTPRAVGQAGEDGRFSLSLSEPVGPGSHDIQVSGEGGEQRITVTVSPAAPLISGPVRAQRVDVGWRIDWMTPGGGVQTTLIILAPAR